MAEEERRVAEAERHTAEAERRLAEAERRVAEAERREAEGERRVAEAERREVEGERRVAEQERREAEGERRVAEGERRAVETERRLAQALGKRERASVDFTYATVRVVFSVLAVLSFAVPAAEWMRAPSLMISALSISLSLYSLYSMYNRRVGAASAEDGREAEEDFAGDK